MSDDLIAISPDTFTRTAPTRRCGNCHACCVHVPMPIFKKPSGIPCIYLAGKNCAGGCCSIYEHRPEACATYQCTWLEGRFPKSMRPDKSGLLFETSWIEWPRHLTLWEGYETRAGALDAGMNRLMADMPAGTAAMIVRHDRDLPVEFVGREDDVNTLLAFMEATRRKGGVTLATPDGLQDIAFSQER